MFLQTDKSKPALTTGELVIVIITVSVTCLQLPLLVEPNVKVTEPAVISAALGEYKGFKVVLLGLNVPVPPAQMPVDVVPVTEPESVAVELFLQTIKLVPALTDGAGVKLI